MKIGFGTSVDEQNRSGKHRFLFDLALEFKKSKHKIDGKSPDIYIFIPGTKPHKRAKNIIRLDGLMLDNTPDNIKRNDKIKRCVDQADAIIYQNEFCRNVYEKLLGPFDKPYACIPNGSNPQNYLDRETDNLNSFFIANCKWRPFKRLNTIIKGFWQAKKLGLKSRLIVTGEVDYKIEADGIEYRGWQDFESLRTLLSQAIASMHLSWLDWCPNAMIEAIVAKCPIIYTKSGGQVHLGCETNGIGISDIDWDGNFCKHSEPPLIDLDEIAHAMLRIEQKTIEVKDERFYISKTATQYYEFFKAIL